MPDTRLPDCKPPRREEILLKPSMRIVLSAEERQVLSTWRRRVLAMYALLVAALTGYLVLAPDARTIAEGVSKDKRAEACVHQNETAGNAVRNGSGHMAIGTSKPACADGQAK